MGLDKVKKRQVSKNTKKGWRKADIADVENFLEDKRLEERLGFSFVSRKNDDLFTIDTKPDEKNLEKLESLKDKRKRLLSETPNCYKILESDSKVPDPIVKRNRIRTAEESQHPLRRKKEAEQKAKVFIKGIQSRKIEADRRRNKVVPGTFSRDIWDEENSLPAQIVSQWIGQPAREHNVNNSNLKETVIRHKNPNKPSILAAIEAPHPGTSYNPSYLEHKDLLDKVVQKESELLKKEAHLERVTKPIFTKIPTKKAEAEWIKEMSQGVPLLDPEASKPDEVEDNEDFKAINPPVNRDKKKDLKTRRKAREELLKKLKIKQAKIEQKKISDIYRLKTIEKDLKEAENKKEQRKKKREVQKELDAGKPKRLGPMKFEESELDFNQASELKGSLRAIKPAGNLLSDRFVSFQKRNFMHVTKRQMKHIKKKKSYVKASHRLNWEIDPLNKAGSGLHRKKRQSSKAVLGQ